MGEVSSNVVKQQLTDFVKRLKENYSISNVILFGSRARNDHLRSSDIDLIIVSSDFEGIHFLDRIVLMLELWEGDVPLEPLCYTLSEFYKMKNQLTIVNAACADGIDLSSTEG